MLEKLEELIRTFDPATDAGIALTVDEAKEIVRQFRALESKLRIRDTIQLDRLE